MAKTLTIRTIETFKPGPVRREIPDGLIAGLYLVVQPSGGKSWAVRYRRGGRPRKLTLGSYPAIDLSNARELARKELFAVAEGRDPCQEKKEAKRAATEHGRDLFQTVAAQFVERYAKANTRESTWRETERLLRRDVVPAWKDRLVQEIARRDVIELLDKIVDRGSPIMANRTLATVRRMFAWCVERGIVETSPCTSVRAPAHERSRHRVLSDEEIRLVWHASDQIGWPFGPLTKLLILTGQRIGEVSRMRWSEVNFDAAIWTIPRERTKNDIAHEVPLNEQALAVLNSLPKLRGESDLVFTTTGSTAVGGFSRAKNRIDTAIVRSLLSEKPLPHWTFHDLRRTVATDMARLGVDLPVIEKVLNHMSGSFAGIVGVYQRHSFADEKRQALEAWGVFVQGLVGGNKLGELLRPSAARAFH